MNLVRLICFVLTNPRLSLLDVLAIAWVEPAHTAAGWEGVAGVAAAWFIATVACEVLKGPNHA